MFFEPHDLLRGHAGRVVMLDQLGEFGSRSAKRRLAEIRRTPEARDALAEFLGP